MKATVILTRCRDGEKEVLRLQQRLERLQKCGVSTAAIEKDAAACRQELQERSRALDAEKVAACRIVDMLPDPACGILYRYFVGGQSQGSIMAALHIAVSTYKNNKRTGMAIAEQLPDATVDALLPAWYLERENGGRATM